MIRKNTILFKIQWLVLLITTSVFAQSTITIPASNPAGTGSAANSYRKPLGSNRAYERSAMLYKQSELNQLGTINSIAFFVDSLNANQYQLASKIEFDNPVSDGGELDYMSIDVYDSMNVLIYHYLSTSPEHVVLNFATPSAAYITIDDSAYTAFILDNIVVEFGNITSTNKNISNDFRLYPNPFSSQTTLQTDNILRNATLTVVNCYGQVIKKMGNISGQTVTLFRDNLPSGLHFIHLTENNKILAVAKLVIVDN
jgi:hypothetical protein